MISMGLRRPRALLLLVAACSGRRHHSTAKKQRDESTITTKSRLVPHDETSAATKSRLVHQAQLTTAFCETRSKRPPPARPDGDTYAGRRLQPYVVLSRQHSGSTRGSTRERNSQLQRLRSRPFSTRFG